jgi:putative sterol carrier protein
MINLDNLFEQMLQRFNPLAAAQVNAIFQYNISDDQSFICEISDANCEFTAGAHESADIELTLSTTLLLEIVSGEADALQAFMEGSILASGDLSLAPALVSLFPAQQ